MADQGGVEPERAAVQTEMIFPDLEVLFHGPAHARDRDQGAQCDPRALGDVAVEVGLVGGVGVNRTGIARGRGSDHRALLGDDLTIHGFPFNGGHVVDR